MSSNHRVEYEALTPAMKEYFSKAGMWMRMKNKGATSESQVLTDNGLVWFRAKSDDGSVERWGYRYTQDENGDIKFSQNDLAAYQHSSDGNIADAAHNGSIVYYYENIDEASSIVSSDIYQYDEASRPEPEPEVNPFQAQYEAAKAVRDQSTREAAAEKSHSKSDYDRTAEELRQIDEDLAKAEAEQEQTETNLAKLEELTLDEGFSESELENERGRIYAVRNRREEQAEFDREYREATELSEKLDREYNEKQAENDAILAELEDLPSDEPDEDFAAEKERIKQAAKEREENKTEADATKPAASDQPETTSDNTETPQSDQTGEASVAADETAAAEAADDSSDASAAIAYAAAVARESVVNHIFKNSFYDVVPAVKWSYSIDFIPTNELIQYKAICTDWAKILTKSVISTEIPSRESTSVVSNFKGVTCELPARTKTSGDLSIRFAETETAVLMSILHELQNISYNRYYPYNELPKPAETVEQASETDENVPTIDRQPSRLALIDHGHQFNIAIYLYRPIDAHAFNPFADGQTPEYVYFFHKCDLYQIGNINFDYTKDSAIDMVGTFMYQHFEEMSFDEYCEKRFVTAEEWANKEAASAKQAELDEMAAKAAARQAAHEEYEKNHPKRQNDPVMRTAEGLKQNAKDDIAAARQSAMASQAAGAGASRAGASSYGRSR